MGLLGAALPIPDFGWTWYRFYAGSLGTAFPVYETLQTNSVSEGLYSYGTGASIAIVDYDISSSTLPVATNLRSFGISTTLVNSWPIYQNILFASNGEKYISTSKPSNNGNTAAVMRTNNDFSSFNFYKQINRTSGSQELVGMMARDGDNSYVMFADHPSWYESYRIYKFDGSGTVLWTANGQYNYGNLRVFSHESNQAKMVIDSSGNLHAFIGVYSNTNTTGQGFEAFGYRILWESYQSDGTLRFSKWIKPANTSIHGNINVFGNLAALAVTYDGSSIYLSFSGTKFASSTIYSSTASLDPSGTINWQRNEGFLSGSIPQKSSIYVKDNKVYIGFCELVVLNASDGSVVMTRAIRNAGGRTGSSILAINDTHIVIGNDNHHHATPLDGSQTGKAWTFNSNNWSYVAGNTYSNTDSLEVIDAINRTTPGWGGFSQPDLTTTTSNISSVTDNGSLFVVQ